MGGGGVEHALCAISSSRWLRLGIILIPRQAPKKLPPCTWHGNRVVTLCHLATGSHCFGEATSTCILEHVFCIQENSLLEAKTWQLSTTVCTSSLPQKGKYLGTHRTDLDHCRQVFHIFGNRLLNEFSLVLRAMMLVPTCPFDAQNCQSRQTTNNDSLRHAAQCPD